MTGLRMTSTRRPARPLAPPPKGTGAGPRNVLLAVLVVLITGLVCGGPDLVLSDADLEATRQAELEQDIAAVTRAAEGPALTAEAEARVATAEAEKAATADAAAAQEATAVAERTAIAREATATVEAAEATADARSTATAEAEEGAAEAAARATEEAQPVNVRTFPDPPADVVECGSSELVADPKADILGVNVGSTRDGTGTVVNVILPGFVEEILKDFSFAVVVFAVPKNGDSQQVHLLETHAGARKQGELDPSTNEAMPGTQDRVRSEGNQARFEIPHPIESWALIAVRTFHMPRDGDKVRCDEAGPFTLSE